MGKEYIGKFQEISSIHVVDEDKKFLNRVPKKPGDNCVYDFTYLNRFIVCHYEERGRIIYVTLDKQTKFFSRMMKSAGVFKEESFEYLIPAARYSVKYTGVFNSTAPDYAY